MEPNTKVTGAPDIPTGTDVTSDVLSEKMLSLSDAISSSSTGIETKIGEIEKGIKEAETAGAQVVTSQFDREIAAKKEQQRQQMEQFQRGEGGFAQSVAAYREMNVEMDKNLKDLEQRKQELILQGHGEATKQITALQVETMKFRQEAMQQTFSNLLGMAGWQTQRRTQQQAEKAQTFAERSNIAGIAMKYGVALGPNDTLDSVIAKIPPGSLTKEEAANLAKIKSETDLNNARIKEILSGDVINAMDSGTIEANARAARIDTSILGKMNLKMRTAATNRAAEIDKESIKIYIENGVANGESKEKLREYVNNPANKLNTFLGMVETDKLFEELYPVAQKKTEKATLAKHAGKVVDVAGTAGWSVFDYITGADVLGNIEARGRSGQ